jgi:hypothetical protein
MISDRGGFRLLLLGQFYSIGPLLLRPAEKFERNTKPNMIEGSRLLLIQPPRVVVTS